MTIEHGRSAADAASGHSAEPEPCSTVSAVPASVPNAWPMFNLNHEVAVKLTEEGLDILRRNHDRLNAGYLFPGNKPGLLGEFRPPKTDAEGWTRFQLWALMHEFGADILMGRPVPFETAIRLDASAIEARRAETVQHGSVADESAVAKPDAQRTHP
jgi:hypothetical protein